MQNCNACVQVLASEYTAIREAGLELEGGYTPPITYITVLKRHRARLFPTDDASNDGKGNVRPGTCVDSGIALAFGFDFYLNAHAGIQVPLLPSPLCPCPCPRSCLLLLFLLLSAALLPQELAHNYICFCCCSLASNHVVCLQSCCHRQGQR